MFKSAYLGMLKEAGQRLNDESNANPTPWQAKRAAEKVFAMCLGCGSPALADAVFCAANAKEISLDDLATLERGYEALDTPPMR